MKKKLSLIIPLLAIFCLISCGYALLSNNMIADENNSNYEASTFINKSIPDVSIKVDYTNIDKKNAEDNALSTQEIIKQKTSTSTMNNNTQEPDLYYTYKKICIHCGEEYEVSELKVQYTEPTYSDCTGYEYPGELKTDHYCIPDGYLAKLDQDVYEARKNPTLMTPELHQRYLELTSQYAEFHKSMDNSIFVPNNNEQPETSTPHNNQEGGLCILNYTCY